jgi:hypothetical protein
MSLESEPRHWADTVSEFLTKLFLDLLGDGDRGQW